MTTSLAPPAGGTASVGTAGGPIVLCGLSHSGKTPLRIVLDAHPEVATTRRSALWTRFRGRFGDLAEPANLARCLDVLLADPGVRQLQPDRRRLERDLAAGPPTYGRLFGLLHQHHAARLGRRRWVDQLGPAERHADELFADHPAARMLHLVRDPRARLAHLARDRGGLGRAGWETARWVHSARLALRNQQQHPQRYGVLRYESLSARPHDVVRDVCTFVGLELVPPMVQALARVTWGHDAARPALGRTLAAFVERHAAAEMRALGYLDRVPRPPAAPPGAVTAPAYLAGWPLNRAAMAAWQLTRARPASRPAGG